MTPDEEELRRLLDPACGEMYCEARPANDAPPTRQQTPAREIDIRDRMDRLLSRFQS